jgi:hypothetical protein
MLTAIIIATSLLFAAIITIDFASGLITLWENAGAKTQPPIEAKPAIAGCSIANQVEPASALPDLWMLPVEEVAIALPAEQIVKQQLLLAPAQVQIATLEWVERNRPPVETFIVEMPNVIEMAKARQVKAAPVVELATREQLESCSIRRLKALAREIKVRNYGSMRLTQLASALENKVTAHQLVA